MDDCISRKAAIDAVDVSNLHRGIVSALQEIIRELPSAQPEIIRCKDCKFFVSDMEWCEADDEHPASPDAFCSWAERRDG